MYSILDIDLDYFNLAENPTSALQDILFWGDRPVDFIVDKHSHALPRWKKQLSRTKDQGKDKGTVLFSFFQSQILTP
jgi:hypothetical protein